MAANIVIYFLFTNFFTSTKTLQSLDLFNCVGVSIKTVQEFKSSTIELLDN